MKSKTRSLISLCRLLESTDQQEAGLRADFAKALEHARRVRGLTVDELARILRVERSTIHRWESGKRFPEAEMMVRVRAWAWAEGAK